MITHRCMESLKARVSIRYEKGWNINGQDAWWMYQPLYDYEWDTTFLTPVAEIRFCPFCGQELEVPKEREYTKRSTRNEGEGTKNALMPAT